MPIENYDLSEIAKFSASASKWWDINSEFKLLHDMNPVRLKYINNAVCLANKTVIDVGCGGGILTESMARLNAKVTGIDLSEAALQVAKLHSIETNLTIEYLQTPVEAIAEDRPEQFDVVTCLEMLEHVPDPASVVSACAKLVKPNGHVFFSTLNRNVKSYFLAILGAEYFLKLLPKNTHDFAKFILPSELAQWARRAGLRIMDMQGIHYNVFTKKFSLVKDISVNYLVHLKKE